MGKGKGQLIRWVIKVQSGLIFLRFLNFRFNILKSTFKGLQTRIPLKMAIFSLFHKTNSRSNLIFKQKLEERT